MIIDKSEFASVNADLKDSAFTSIGHRPVDPGAREETGSKYFREKDSPVSLLVRLKLRIVGQSCSICAGPIKRRLEKIRGVESVTVNSVLDLVFVDYDPHVTDGEEIKETIRKSGYSAMPAR